MGCLILMELPVKPFALLMHGQGLVDEGLTRSLQGLLCLLRIVAGSHRLKKPIDDGEEGLAPSRHAGSAGQVLYTLQRGTRRPLGLRRLRGSIRYCCCFAGTIRRWHRCAGHHHLCRLYWASATPSVSQQMRRRICRHQHLLLANTLSPHVHLVGTERHDPAIPGERPAAETSGVVADGAERAQPLDEARDHAHP
jgi:hypothetical protein